MCRYKVQVGARILGLRPANLARTDQTAVWDLTVWDAGAGWKRGEKVLSHTDIRTYYIYGTYIYAQGEGQVGVPESIGQGHDDQNLPW